MTSSLGSTIETLSGRGVFGPFCSLAAQFAGYDDLATLSTRLHNEAEDTITGASDGKTTDQFVTEGFSLSNGAKATSRHLLGIQFDGTIGIVEALLNDGGQFTNTLTFVVQHILSARREDDNLRARRRHAHLDSAVTIFGQLPRQELIQFGFENSILNELSFFGYLDRHLN